MASSKVGRRVLGSQGFTVSALGLGCMGMSAFYGPPKPEEEMIQLIRSAVDMGVTFLDTSDIYGPHTNEVLVGKAIQGIRDKVQLATKFAIRLTSGNQRAVCGDPAYVREACEGSLKRLNVEYIDLYYVHRIDPTVPIEITVGAMAELVKEGKVKYIGLSEASAGDIRRAHKVHPITAIQLEWSLSTRDVEPEIVKVCRELNIGIVPYSPLGRGLLSKKSVTEQLADNDYRKNLPRFSGDNYEANQRLFEKLEQIAASKGCTAGQVALAWVLTQGDDVVPIPGTTKLENLKQNVGAVDVALTPADLELLSKEFAPDAFLGERYPEQFMKASWQNVNTPPLESWTKK